MIRKNKGITLIEVIVTIAILGIVMAAAYSINLLGIKAYSLTDQNTRIQTNLTTACLFLTDTTRNAVYVDFSPPDWTEQYQCIFIEDGMILYRNEAGIIIEKTEPVIDQLEFEIVDMDGGFMLEFSLTARAGKRSSSRKSSVYLNNVTGSSPGRGNRIYLIMP